MRLNQLTIMMTIASVYDIDYEISNNNIYDTRNTFKD